MAEDLLRPHSAYERRADSTDVATQGRTPAMGRRQVAVVLGMHRSGTSMLSHMMQFLGCDMADETDKVSEKNAGGFWERPELVAIHDEILAVLDLGVGSANHVLPFPPRWWRRKEVQGLKSKLITYVDDQLSRSFGLWGFKDPRTCRLLPLWDEIFQSMRIDPIYVHALRKPQNSAASMSIKNAKQRDLSVGLSEAMWLAYNYDIARYTAGYNVISLDYDSWFSGPGNLVRRLADHLGFSGAFTEDDLNEIVVEVVRKDLRHQNASEGEIRGTISASFYNALYANQDGSRASLVQGQLPFIKMLFQTIRPLIGELVAFAALREEHAAIQPGLRELELRREQVIELKVERNNLQSSAAALDVQVQQLTERAQDAEAAHQGRQAALTEALLAGEADLAEAKAQVVAMDTKISSLIDKSLAAENAQKRAVAEIARLHAGLETAAQTLSQNDEQHRQEVAGLRRVGLDLDAELALLKKALLTKETELAELSAALEDAGRIQEKLKLELGRSAEANAALTDAITAARERDDTRDAALEEAIARLERVEDGAQVTAGQMASEVSTLTAALAQAEDVKAALQAELTEALAQHDAIVATYTEDVTAQGEALERVSGKLQNLQMFNEQLQNELLNSREALEIEHQSALVRERENVAGSAAQSEQLRIESDRVAAAEMALRDLQEDYRQLETKNVSVGDLAVLRVVAANDRAELWSQRDEADLHRLRVASERLASEADGPATQGEGDLLQASDAVSGDVRSIITGEVTTTAAGIAGRAKLDHAPGRPLVIEARVGDRVVATTITNTEETGTDVSAERVTAGFFLSWDLFDQKWGGQTARLMVAGHAAGDLGAAIIPDLRETRPMVRSHADRSYYQWIEQYHRFTSTDRSAASAYYRDNEDRLTPVTLILVGPDRSTDEMAFTIKALRQQVFGKWELLVPSPINATASPDKKIRAVDAETLFDLATLATGQSVCFIEAGDSLEPDALLRLCGARLRTGADIMYSDEDHVDRETGARSDPWLKGDWNHELFFTQDYASRLALVPRDHLLRFARGAADWAGVYATLMTMVTSLSPPRIEHMPMILYHRRIRDQADIVDVGREALDQASIAFPGLTFERDGDGICHPVWPLPTPEPKVSLIVPTRNRVDLLQPCVDGLLNATDYAHVEIIVIDNQSDDPKTLDYLNLIAADTRVKVLQWDAPFNYSAINRFGVDHATGEMIGLINNDLKVIQPDWLSRLVRHAARDDVGAVGARLLYGDGTLQHAGVTMGIGTASHRYKGKPSNYPGHAGHLLVAHDVTAVTAACMVMRRAVWDQTGGLSEDFPVAYNDIDLCLAIGAAGLRIIYEPHAVLFHLESQSRGLDRSGEAKERLASDREKLISKWGMAVHEDPHYSPNLSNTSTEATLAIPPRVDRAWQFATPSGNLVCG